MALSHPSWTVDTTFSGIDITTATSVYEFTAAADAKVQFTVKLTNAVGNGDYVVYLKRQWLGTGTASVVLPKTTCPAASGETVIEFISLELSVKATDVVDVMIDGLAGDNSASGAIRISADNPSVFDQANDVPAVNVTLWKDAAAPDAPPSKAELDALETHGDATWATADVSALATSAALATVDGIVDDILEDTGTTLPAALETIDNYIDTEIAAIKAKTDLISADGSVSVTSAISGSTITILRGDSLSVSIATLGDISTRSKLWFTAKVDTEDADTSAVIQIEETDGLVRLNGAAGTGALGDITVTDENAGDITITLDETATDDLAPRKNMSYDVQMLTAAGAVTTLTSGTLHVTADVTRAVA